MKGLGVQQLMALIALHNAGIVPRATSSCLRLPTRRRSGARGIQWMIANH